MKYLSLLIFIFPIYLFGQSPDTTCVCGKVAPSILTPKIVEAMAEYPGGNEVLKDFIKSNTKLEPGENGKIEISFIIGCKGTTCGYEVLSKVGLSTQTEMKIMDVLKKMGKWNQLNKWALP